MHNAAVEFCFRTGNSFGGKDDDCDDDDRV